MSSGKAVGMSVPDGGESRVGRRELQNLAEEVDAEVKTQLLRAVARSAPGFEDILRFHFDWPSGDPREEDRPLDRGKKTRPLLALITARAISGEHQHVMPEAVCLELIHNASLILDDVMDHDACRRGRPCVWKQWGRGVAITTGVALYTLALSEYGRIRGEPYRRTQAVLMEACTETCVAQLDDLQLETEVSPEAGRALKVAAGRCALIASATRIGADLSGADDGTVDAYHEYGVCLGVARALSNDYRDIWGERDEAGNPPGGDIRYGKKTFPIIHALGHGSDRSREALARLCGGRHPLSDEDVARVRDLLTDAGADRATLALVEQHATLATEALEATGIDNRWQRHLKDLVRDPSLTAV